jgi:hypothetical protein
MIVQFPLVHRFDERSQALSEMGTYCRRPNKWCGRSKSIARLQTDVSWHEYFANISSSY